MVARLVKITVAGVSQVVDLTPIADYAAPVVDGVPRPQIGMSPPSQSFGISDPPKWDDEVTQFEVAVGTRANTVMFYMSLFEGFQSGIERIFAAGKTGMMTLEPFTTQSPLAVDFAGIMAGTYDTKLRQWARFWNGRGPIRFAHEMNGTWYPWGQSLGPTGYLALWSKVRGVWRDEETATSRPHAPWVWCPNIGGAAGTFPFEDYYPGDDACEYVGLDGYSNSATSWPSFEEVFAADLAALATLSSRPATIGETSIDIAAPDRAGWVTGMFDYLAAHPELVGFNWYERLNAPENHDYRLIGDRESCAAFRAGAAVWATSRT